MSDILITQDIIDIISNIKNDIRSTRNKVLVSANQELIYLYFRIGKTISENSKYGSNFINKLSSSLKTEFPGSTGFSPRNLARMRKFYEVYVDLSNLPTALAKLPWSFNCLLIDKISEEEKRIWYANKCLDNGWSYVVLNHQIDLCLYERQADNNKKITNFDVALPATQSELATDMMKDPYIFELANLKEKVLEKDVEEAMLNSVKNVLMEFGNGFSFVGNQFRISTNDNDYFIDLLFYHLHLRCYVVVELKVVDFKPEFLGQLQFYVTAVDETLKHEFDNPTIGLLLCKSKDKVAAEWALKSTNAPVGVASYEIRKYLPSEDEIIKYLNLEENK